MNICALSGKLASNPIAVGDGQTIKFSLLTRYPYKKDVVAEGTAHVPCVLFDATAEQKNVLLNQNRDKLRIELVGRVVRSGFVNTEGKTLFNTEVAIDSSGMAIHRVR